MSARDRLSIVIPTVGRSAVLLPLLEQLLAEAAEGDRIVVVDQSTGADRERIAGFAGPRPIRLIHRERRGLPAARNVGIAESHTPLILFLDDDVILGPGCLEAHRQTYLDPTVGGVVGRIRERRLVPNSRRTTNRIDRGGRIRTNLEGDRPTEIETLKGANMSFRRQALDQSGPFDERFAGTALLEDADLSTRVRRAGWRLRYEPRAEVEHLHLPTGGVRGGEAGSPEWWRFHNTGVFVGKHRGRRDLPLVAATFGAIALLRAWQARDPRVAPRLLGALRAGLVTARDDREGGHRR